MKHLNGNLLGCLDVETTGFRPGYHDILEVAVVILDEELKPAQNIMPFVMELQPKRIENIDLEALRIQGKNYDSIVKQKACRSRKRVVDITTKGCDADLAADMFGDWFEQLKLAPFKKIMPIACNWAFDRMFMLDWLGDEGFNQYFHPQYRDVMCMALFDNDVADWRHEPFQYPKCNLQYLCNVLNVQNNKAHTAFDDVIATIECYRKLIQRTEIRNLPVS